VRRKRVGTFVRSAVPSPASRHTRSARIGLAYGLTPGNLACVESCQEHAMAKNGMLTVYDVGEDKQDPVKERQFLEIAEREGFLGVALLPTPLAPLNTDLYRELRRKGMKTALLAPYAVEGDNHVVFFQDYAHAGYLAVGKMSMAGYTSVCLAHANLPRSHQLMREGMVQAAKDFGLAVLNNIFIDLSMGDTGCDDTPLRSAACETIRSLPGKTAILATQSLVCLAVSRLARRAGRRYPADLGLCVCSYYVHQELEDVSTLLFPLSTQLESAIDYLLDAETTADKSVTEYFKAVYYDKGSL